MLYRLLRSIAILLFKALFQFEVYGRQNIPQKGPFILASNHLSFLDPVALGVASPRKLFFLARDDLFKNRLFGKLISLLGASPLKKGIVDIEAIRKAIRRLREGEALALFPEGGRIKGGNLGEPQRGIGLLAQEANAPVVPALIEGSNLALPIEAKFIRLKKVRVYFGRPIFPQSDKSKESSFLVAHQVMEEISRLKRYFRFGD